MSLAKSPHKMLNLTVYYFCTLCRYSAKCAAIRSMCCALQNLVFESFIGAF